MPMTLLRSGRLGVISRSYTTSPAARPKYSANGWPTSAAGFRIKRPSTSSPSPSSFGEHIIPCDSTFRIFPTLMVNGGDPAAVGNVAPGSASGTLSPTLKFFAPQTICLSPFPSATRQTESLSAFGCLSLARTCATTTPWNSPPIDSTPSTSTPSIVRCSPSSSGDHEKSTYCLSQLRVTFILKAQKLSRFFRLAQPNKL